MTYFPAKFNKDYTGSIAPSNSNFCALLAANTALSVTVPGTDKQKYRAYFRSSYTAEIWVNYAATATIPGAGTGSLLPYKELIPLNEERVVLGGSAMSFISSGTPALSIHFALIEDTTNG